MDPGLAGATATFWRLGTNADLPTSGPEFDEKLLAYLGTLRLDSAGQAFS